MTIRTEETDNFSILTEPFDYGGLTLKNRIIFAPTTMGMKSGDEIKKMKRIAEGGCAMIIVGDVPVTKSHFVPSLQTKKGFRHYSELCAAIHEGGAKACAQLHEDDTVMKGMMGCIPKLITHKMTMDDLREVQNEAIAEMITDMDPEEVQTITDAFGDAAELALKAGFDMIEVHGDRMCGAFSSSLFNKRNDEWGGSAEKRAKFACDSVRSIRKRFPTLPIDYKLCIREEEPFYGRAGITEKEAEIFVPMLEEAGVTSFHVTLADHSSLEDTIPPANHPYYKGEGCFLKFAEKVKSLTDKPVCGVGGLSTPAFIVKAIEDGRMDAAGMSRQLLADPDWPDKVKEGKTNEIRRCIRCNRECLGGLMHHHGTGCIYDEERKKK